jgi:hypothetical protein
MKKTLLTINAENGQSNGFMNSEWYVNNNFLYSTTDQNIKDSKFVFEIQLPCVIKVVLSGKNPNLDTCIENNKIVSDKFLHVTSASLGHYPISDNVLYHKLVMFTPDGEAARYTPFFHTNGVAIFDFQEDDALLWHLRRNDFFQI